MRRAIGAVLVGLGLFAIVLTILLPTVVVSKSKKTPLDLNITQRSSGTAALLDSATNTTRKVAVRATRIVHSDSHASDGKNTTVNEGLCIVVVQGDTPDCVPSSDPRLLSVTTDRVTTDRKSAQAVHVAKYNENVNGDTSVRHSGMAYKWPIDAKKQTYQFFETNLKKAFPAKYEGTSKIKGLTVYKYVCETGTHPYQVQGLFPGTYTDTRTVWVEPRTGAIIKGVEHTVQALDSGQVALDATLTFDPEAIDFQAKFAKSKINDLKKAQLWGPLVLGIFGLAALIGGIIVLRSTGADGDHPGRRAIRRGTPPPDEPSYADDPDPEPSVPDSSHT
jgi:hypothetical protein